MLITLFQVNGNWGQWKYTECTVSCGGGKWTKRRFCDNPKPEHGGQRCNDGVIGPLGQLGEFESKVTNEPCNTQLCPSKRF